MTRGFVSTALGVALGACGPGNLGTIDRGGSESGIVSPAGTSSSSSAGQGAGDTTSSTSSSSGAAAATESSTRETSKMIENAAVRLSGQQQDSINGVKLPAYLILSLVLLLVGLEVYSFISA